MLHPPSSPRPLVLLPLLLAGACTRPGPIPTKPLDTAPDELPDAEAEDPVEEVESACEGIAHPALRLNELVAANLDGLRDEDGETSDWIELINLDTEAVQLEGWGLGEAVDESPSWRFPSLSLEPGALRLVFASGKDRADADGTELHTDFAIDAFDARVALVAPDRCVVDALSAGRLYGDISYGRPAETSDRLGYFLEPTPGLPNSTEARPGFAPTPRLSPQPGVHAAPLEATITLDAAEGVLRYTLDGSSPSEESPIYAGALTLDASASLVVLRARAWVDGLWPSRVATSTWSSDPALLSDDLLVVSLVVDPFDLWDEATGIYAFGPADYETSYPYFGANFWEDWERPLHVEVFEPDGDLVIEQDAGVKIHGGYTRAFDQKSFRLIARAAHGPETFEYPFFPTEARWSFENVILEGAGDWCPVHVENAFVDAVFRDAEGRRLRSLDTQAWEPAVVYLNGAFWGLYAFREKLDEHWIAAQRGVGPEDLDRMELGWTHDANWDLDQGTWDAFYAMNVFVDRFDLSDEAAWALFLDLADVENLATTVLAEGWWGNSDWWWNNLRLWRDRADPGPFRWMVFDLGHGWTDVNYNHIATSVGWSGDGLPIANALQNEAFRVLLANQAAELLATSLTAEATRARLDEMLARIEPVIPEQYATWCGLAPRHWGLLADNARAWTERRPEVFRGQVQASLGLATPVTLRLDVEPPGSGRFALSLIEVDPPFEGSFFPSIPIRLTALPTEGWRFSGWSEGSAGDEATAILTLDGPLELVAYFD
jgi:hypothetical protein